jgi:hypothetical protein
MARDSHDVSTQVEREFLSLQKQKPLFKALELLQLFRFCHSWFIFRQHNYVWSF